MYWPSKTLMSFHSFHKCCFPGGPESGPGAVRMKIPALCPQSGTVFRAQGGCGLGNLTWREEGKNPSSLSGDPGIPKRSLVREFASTSWPPFKKALNKMSELERKIRGLYTLHRKVLYSAVLKNKTKQTKNNKTPFSNSHLWTYGAFENC